MDNTEETPIAQHLFDNVGPSIKEYLSGYILVGYRADNDTGVVVCDCSDKEKRDDLQEVISAAESWGHIQLYEE